MTALDVANTLGVSRSTVNRAFTPGAFVASETRTRILEAADALGYRPNAIAQALISQRSRIVGIVIGGLTNPFHAILLEEMTERLQAAGLIAITVRLRPDQPIESIIPTLQQYQVGCAILTSLSVSRGMIAACRRAGLKVALLNRVEYGSDAVSVCADVEQGGRLAALHLADCGYRRIAIVEGTAGAWTNEARTAGFRQGLRDAGLSAIAELPGDYTYQAGLDAADRLVAMPEPPDAVLCANDLTALGLIDGMRGHGRHVPDDVGVIGMDNIPMAAWRGYDLTSVHLPFNRMLDRITEVALAMVAEDDIVPETTLIACRLILRGSTRQAGEPR